MGKASIHGDAPVMPSVILGGVPHGMKHEWDVFIDGIPIRHPFYRVDIVLRKGEGDGEIYRHGQLGLMGSEGNEYEAFAYYEAGGGGTVVMPYARIDGRLYVGVVVQHRQLMGQEPVMTAAGGYRAPTDASAQVCGERELREEVTNQTDVILRSYMLPGEPVNPNRAVFITAREGEGVHYFAAEINPTFLRKGEGSDRYGFVPEAAQVDPGVEKALKTVFVPVREAALCKCGLLRAGLTALLVDLEMI
jgi:hypothetical protein